MSSTLTHSLHDLGFGDKETRVYEALTKLGEAKAADIAKKAEIARTTTISILEKFHESGYVTTHRYRGVQYYWIESPDTLVNLFREKTALAEQLKDTLTEAYRSEAHFPTVQTFDTRSAIKQFITAFLSALDMQSTLRTIDAAHEGNYAKIYPGNIGELLYSVKKRRKITTHTLVPADSMRNVDPKKIALQDILVRELPHGLKFSGSLWITKQSLIHFSGNPPFLVETRHERIVEGMRSLFDYLWRVSIPYEKY